MRGNGGQELKRGYEEGMGMSVSMGRRGKLHERGLTVHQLNEPHTADKDDERNNDDSGGANIGGAIFRCIQLACCV